MGSTPRWRPDGESDSKTNPSCGNELATARENDLLKTETLTAGRLAENVVGALDDLKGIDILNLDISAKASFADAMILATGTSVRHVRALAETARHAARELGLEPAIEGDQDSDWVLLDLGDVIVHVMTGERREFYALEKLWGVDGVKDRSAASSATTADMAVH